MNISIVDGFIPTDLADSLSIFLDELATPTPQGGIKGALGYDTSEDASKVGTSARAVKNYSSDKEQYVSDLESVYKNVHSYAEQFFNLELDLVNCTYQSMSKGAKNELHADSVKLDGSTWRDDGVPEELEFSALLYLNNHSIDFSGGLLKFHLQNLAIEPKKGQLVVFKGDIDHIHEVTEVLSGERKNLVFFYSRKGNISSTKHFNY
jgi:Rps23 Pro-64 3,4-dihydroxylase Tpa1-like proline 4-hydroxylase